MTTKITVTELHTLVVALGAKAEIDAATIEALSTRLDTASGMCARMHAHIKALQEQGTKTRKQLWFLQKVAKGEFPIGSKAA